MPRSSARRFRKRRDISKSKTHDDDSISEDDRPNVENKTKECSVKLSKLIDWEKHVNCSASDTECDNVSRTLRKRQSLRRENSTTRLDSDTLDAIPARRRQSLKRENCKTRLDADNLDASPARRRRYLERESSESESDSDALDDIPLQKRWYLNSKSSESESDTLDATPLIKRLNLKRKGRESRSYSDVPDVTPAQKRQYSSTKDDKHESDSDDSSASERSNEEDLMRKISGPGSAVRKFIESLNVRTSEYASDDYPMLHSSPRFKARKEAKKYQKEFKFINAVRSIIQSDLVRDQKDCASVTKNATNSKDKAHRIPQEENGKMSDVEETSLSDNSTGDAESEEEKVKSNRFFPLGSTLSANLDEGKVNLLFQCQKTGVIFNFKLYKIGVFDTSNEAGYLTFSKIERPLEAVDFEIYTVRRAFSSGRGASELPLAVVVLCDVEDFVCPNRTFLMNLEQFLKDRFGTRRSITVPLNLYESELQDGSSRFGKKLAAWSPKVRLTLVEYVYADNLDAIKHEGVLETSDFFTRDFALCLFALAFGETLFSKNVVSEGLWLRIKFCRKLEEKFPWAVNTVQSHVAKSVLHRKATGLAKPSVVKDFFASENFAVFKNFIVVCKRSVITVGQTNSFLGLNEDDEEFMEAVKFDLIRACRAEWGDDWSTSPNIAEELRENLTKNQNEMVEAFKSYRRSMVTRCEVAALAIRLKLLHFCWADDPFFEEGPKETKETKETVETEKGRATRKRKSGL